MWISRSAIVPRLAPLALVLVVHCGSPEKRGVRPAPAAAAATPERPLDPRMAWFQQARLGMFIHWGPVALRGTEIGWSRAKQVPKGEYDKLYKRFNPANFDADAWMMIAKEAGMKYMVLTTKHHDGFALWPSKYTNYHIGNTPFKRDVVKELTDAGKRHGVRFGAYYSIADWYHPDYPTDSPGGKQRKPNPDMPRYYEFLKNQTKELIDNYGPLLLFWFDGDWEQPWTREYGDALYADLLRHQSSLIINNRVSKGGGTTTQSHLNAGDYDTPEQRIGSFNRERPWESAITVAVDDHPATRWATDPGTRSAWIEIDLGAPTTIARVIIDEPASYRRVQAFELQAHDGQSWRTFHSGAAIGSNREIRVQPITARRVRLNILSASDAPTITEFQLFEPE